MSALDVSYLEKITTADIANDKNCLVSTDNGINNTAKLITRVPVRVLVLIDSVNPQHVSHPLIFELAMFPPDTMPRKRVNPIFFF